MTNVSNTPSETTTVDLSAEADRQYEIFRNGLNTAIVGNAMKVSGKIATPETNDRIRLVRIGGDIFNAFLSGLDETVRQHYTCKTCRSFFNGYGSLAFLTKDLELVPLAFPTQPEDYMEFTGDLFVTAYENVLKCFDVTSVTPMTNAMYEQMGNIMGTGECGGFHHIHNSDAFGARANVENLLIDTTQVDHSFGPAEATLIHETFRKYNELLVEKTFGIPETKLRDRDIVELNLCIKMTKDYMGVSSKLRQLWVTRYLLDLGLGIVHFKNSVVGLLIDDLEKLGVDEALNNYYGYTDPTRYKRKVALPKEREFEASVQYLNDNDWTRRLELRFAKFEEVEHRMVWKPQAKTIDAFAKLRQKVKTEADAKALALPVEKLSLLSFNHILKDLIDKGELVGIAYKADVLRFGTFSRNVAEDAGAAYKDGEITHEIYVSSEIRNIQREIQFNSAQADGLFTSASSSGSTLNILAFANANINMGIRTLNYVECLVPELHPHQRTIDAWADATWLNPVNTNDQPQAVQGVVVTVPLVVNPSAAISLITDKNIQEFIIISER